jgi:beta-mannosidase
LDTVATIWINGIEVGRSENMHLEARFEIKHALKSGENEIRIRFDSAVHYARNMRDKLGDLPHANSYRDANGECEPFHFIRKNACNFGWDWGPALITCGVWKAISVEAWSVARIKSVRPLVKVANEKVAVVDVLVEVERLPSSYEQEARYSLLLQGEVYGHRINLTEQSGIKDDKATFTFFFREPQLWWPRGYGEQSLYCLVVGLDFNRNKDLGQFSCQIGLRETELDQSPDDIGAAWTLKINNREIWCKGANWIPDDVFLPRANEPQRLRARLNQAVEMGMNTIRVWGGGIYETDEFYSICDELGLIVWQDFPFACAAYSEESPMKELVELEARFNVARLCKHPSLVLWNGCNENIWGYFDWNWQAQLEGRTWGAGYYFDVLPRIVDELDGTRPYYAGSPYSGSMDIHPNADAFGPKHMWDTWNEVNHTHFRKYSPRFASEFGHQAPPTFTTLARAIPVDERNPFSPSMLLHQKAIEGNDKLHARLLEHFAMPDLSSTNGLADWIYLTQLVQARAMTTAVEWFRTRSSCRGALYWQLNDCWPATSWSAIDGDGRPKPLFYASQQFFRERLLTIQPDGEHLALWAHNDTDREWADLCDVWLMAMEGESPDPHLFFYVGVPPRSVKKLGTLKHMTPTDRQSQFIWANSHESDAFWFFDIDKNLAYPEPKIHRRVERKRSHNRSANL